MAEFDLGAAREAGHSDEEIVGFLSKQLDFDLEGAQKEGYPTAEILDSLMARIAPPAEPEPPGESSAIMGLLGSMLQPGVVPGAAAGQFAAENTPALIEEGKAVAEHAKERVVEPYGALLGKGQEGAVPPIPFPMLWLNAANFIQTHEVEDKIAAAVVAGEDPQVAKKEAIRENTINMGLLGFDLVSLAAAGPVQGVLRTTAAKFGLKPALQTIAATAAEGGGYLGTYNGLEATMEGHTAAHVGKKVAEGTALGAGIGAVAGLFGISVAFMRNRASMVRAAEESAAGRQFFEDAKAMLKEEYPHLNPHQVEANARRVAFEGTPLEDLKLPSPQKPAKGGISGAYDAEDVLPFDKAIDDLSRPAIPDVVIEERARRVPFFGEKELRKYTRAEEVGPPDTIRDHVTKVRNGFAGLFQAEPGATNEVKDLFFQARATLSSTSDRANQTIYNYIFKLLGKDAGEKTALLSDYMISMDRVATMRSGATVTGGMEQAFIPGIGKTEIIGSGGVTRYPSGPGGTAYEQWVKSAEKIAAQVEKNPELVQAAKSTRWLLDEMHQTMIEYGMISPQRYREGYFPAQRLYEMAEGLAQDMRGTAIGSELSATLKRNSSGEIIQTNLVRVLQKSLTALNRKVAEIELWRAIEANPRLNLTDLFEPGQAVPKGFKVYRPGPGMPGYVADDAIEDAMNGAIDGIGVPKAHFTQGSFVLPEDLANRLQHFYERPGSPVERQVYNAANKFARQLTIYNLSNTNLNAGSDFFMALMGMPGERSNAVGFLRFLPGSIKAAYRGAFGKESKLYARAAREGIAGGTFIRSVGGEPVSKELAPAILQGREPTMFSKMHDFYDNLIRLRQAVEATPRITAGQAAEAVTGDPAEFARVGRQITLPYGAGDPRISRVPLMRLLATFWRYQGMATDRIFRLATTKGSRARGIAALAAPAVGAAVWNLQNEDFRQVEYSLSQYDRNHLHVILPDPRDPAKPFRKENGQPMVFRMRFWAPEEVAGMYGLGNLPGRFIDVAAGYTSPGEFVGEVGSEVASNVASLAAPLTTAQQLLTGRSNLTGQQQELFERTETTLPLFYHFGKFFETAHNEGLLAAAGQAPLRIMGIRPAGARLGRADAKIQNLRRQLRESQMRLRVAGAKGDKFRMQHYQKKIDRLSKRLDETQAGRKNIEQIEGGQ